MKASILSDELLGELMAAGQADVLIAIPTLDNTATVGPVVRAVTEAFSTSLLRERTVLLNADGGSTDGTPECVRRAAADPKELVVASHPLRTVHRITSPYHGVPGRGGALQLVFAAAELLRVKVVAVVDPDATGLTADEVFRLVAPVLRQGHDFVKPVLPRSPWEGPLVSQLVRPLMRATFGQRLMEPVETQFSCSARFASSALAGTDWSDPHTEHGLDVWLSARAMAGDYRLAQVPVQARPAPGSGRRPPLARVFQQVVGTVFQVLEATCETWQLASGWREVPLLGAAFPPSEVRPPFDVEALWRGFREGLPQLHALLSGVLSTETLEALSRRADSEAGSLDDALWVRTVYEFLAAEHHRVMGAGQLAQALLPLYEGRIASFLRDTEALDAEAAHERLEALAAAFESGKPGLISLWCSR